MFEVGDKVRYVPNEDSPRNASTDGAYMALEGQTGIIEHVDPAWFSYPYLVAFANRSERILFSEAELVKVA